MSIISKHDVLEFTKEPLAGSNLTNLLRLCAQNNFYIGWQYIPRFLYTLLLSSIMGPVKTYEKLRYGHAIIETEIKHHPLFIIGHWRSGTTYLHNVLSQDQNFGFITTFQAYIPGLFLTGEKLFKPVVGRSLPKKRPMDGVDMGADLPQEDQYAVGALSPFSYYHGWCFPRHMDYYYDRVFLDDQSTVTKNEWKRVYRYLLKKATLSVGGKRLVLKNQDNTVHIPLLLNMFPQAQFVNIHRHPYQVYSSMMKFLRIAVPLYCLQKPPSESVLEEIMMDFYARFIKKYLVDRDMIPDGLLAEMRYEDFIQNPLKETQHMYETLSLSGFKEAEPYFKTYLKTQIDFKSDTYQLSKETKKRIYNRWQFAFDAFGYEP